MSKKKKKDDGVLTRIKEIERLSLEAQRIFKDFQSNESYKETKGITEGAKRAVDFYEGRQYIDNKNRLPFEKVKANVIQTVVDSKEANVLSKVFALNFIINNDNYSTENVTKFASFQMKEMGQDELNRNGTHDNLLKGTMIWYFSWDEFANGQFGVKNGAIRGFNIDLADIAVANPLNRDVQRQEWIILRSRESVKAIKEMCDTLDDEEKKHFIVSNPFQSRYTNDIEQEGEETAYVYTKFFKQDGEVYFMKSTENIVFQKARCLNPNVEFENLKREKDESIDEEVELLEEDSQTGKMIGEAKNTTPTTEMQEKFKANLYPFVIDSFIKRDNSIYGISFAEQMIPLQKVINHLINNNVLICAKSAMPTLVVKEGALGTQKIDLSKPGNVIIDKSGAGMKGIDVLNTGSTPTTQFQLAQELISMTKDLTRASDVLDDGRNISSSSSGYAISQLMTIQEKPVAQWQQVLARCIEKEGQILEMYYKLYYNNVTYSAVFSEAEIEEQRKFNPGIDPNMLTRYQTATFNGEDYINSPFNIIVEVGETAKFSELSVAQILDTLFLNGTVEKLSVSTLKMWAKLVPSYYFPESKKREFAMLLDEREEGEIAQLRAQLQEAQGLLERAQLQNQAIQKQFSDSILQSNEHIKKLELIAKSNMDKSRSETSAK